MIIRIEHNEANQNGCYYVKRDELSFEHKVRYMWSDKSMRVSLDSIPASICLAVKADRDKESIVVSVHQNTKANYRIDGVGYVVDDDVGTTDNDRYIEIEEVMTYLDTFMIVLSELGITANKDDVNKEISKMMIAIHALL